MHYELPHVKADASVEAVLNSFFVAYESISKFEESISLAKNGYSTKDRPFAENRGFGISTNLKIVTDVLGGTFSIYSGKALYIKDKQSVKMIDLPYDVEWNGTIVIARVPLPPASFNMYNYI